MNCPYCNIEFDKDFKEEILELNNDKNIFIEEKCPECYTVLLQKDIRMLCKIDKLENDIKNIKDILNGEFLGTSQVRKFYDMHTEKKLFKNLETDEILEL